MRISWPAGIRRPLPTVLSLALVVSGALAADAPAALAGDASCVVTNLTSPSGTIGTLQAAVDLADPGDTLQVTGTCRFGTVIDKRLTIVGAPSETLGPPTLDGESTHRVLWIKSGRTVSIKDLAVDFGMAPGDSDRIGGGILNDGTLTLTRVSVTNGNADMGGGVMNHGTLTVAASQFRGNEAAFGAAIANAGTLTLKGTSELTANFATNGGGIYTLGDVTIGGSVAIHHNEATSQGGGIWIGVDPAGPFIVRLRGTASVRDNSAQLGGGIHQRGSTLILEDSATVRANQADVGGGVYLSFGRLTLNDTASVRGNRAREAAGIDTLATDGKAFIRMTDRSSVKGNVASRQTAAIRLTGSLLMEDSAVVRDNSDGDGFSAIATGALPGRPVTFTMRDRSRVTSNELPAGGSAVARFIGCGKSTYVGVKARVVGNTPKNIKTYTSVC